MQTIIPLSGQGAIRLTTARYYTPSGRSIQATGIDPDIVVEQAKIEAVDLGDQRTEATLRNRLPSEEELNGEAENAGDETPQNGRSSQAQQDYQLARALDLLHGLALFGGKAVN